MEFLFKCMYYTADKASFDNKSCTPAFVKFLLNSIYIDAYFSNKNTCLLRWDAHTLKEIVKFEGPVALQICKWYKLQRDMPTRTVNAYDCSVHTVYTSPEKYVHKSPYTSIMWQIGHDSAYNLHVSNLYPYRDVNYIAYRNISIHMCAVYSRGMRHTSTALYFYGASKKNLHKPRSKFINILFKINCSLKLLSATFIFTVSTYNSPKFL